MDGSRSEHRSDTPAGRSAFADALDELEWLRSVDVDARYSRARLVEQQAAAAGDELARQRARLVAADMLHRSGEVTEGARLAVEVMTWAEGAGAGATALRARSHMVLSSVFAGIGDSASALDQAVRALDLRADDAPRRELGNHLVCLADALALAGSVDEARRRYHEAQAEFDAIDDTERELNALNNLIALESECGEYARASEAAERLADLSFGRAEMNPSYAETIARARLGGGDLEGAERSVRLGMELLRRQGDSQAATPAELLLTQAEVLLGLGRVVDAADAIERCLDVCRRRDLAGIRVEATRVQAEVRAAAGDYRDAYETYRRFHHEAATLRSVQQEAAARTRHALFETAEARRDADRFWRQARTDPLTDIYNRRFIDETLPRYLAGAAADAGSVLVAAIVDIDHFKAINDRHSHAVGDQVLVRVAAKLREVAQIDGSRSDRPGFAARLGGEEFLLVRTISSGSTLEPVDTVRRRVAAFDWSAIAPGLQVRLSAGVAVARPADTQSTLLGRADQYLYMAKTDGRDRVIGETGKVAARRGPPDDPPGGYELETRAATAP